MPDTLGWRPSQEVGSVDIVDLDVCRIDEPPVTGYFPTEERNSLLAQHVWVTWLAGFWHHEGAKSDSFAPGEPLALVSEPDNQFDKHAVSVWSADRNLMGGWIPAAYAVGLETADRLGRSLMESLDEDGERDGLLIAVSHMPLELKVAEDAPSAHVLATARRTIRKRPVRFEEDPEAPPPIDPIEAMRMMLGEPTDPDSLPM